jgi:hypothetical protein
MQLNKIDDPRSNLQKARRRQLVEFAHAKGMTEISEQMDADLIRERLMQRGFSQIPLRTYSLGHAGRHEVPPIGPKAPPPATPPGLSADELQQFREWQQQRQVKPRARGRHRQNGHRRPAQSLQGEEHSDGPHRQHGIAEGKAESAWLTRPSSMR